MTGTSDTFELVRTILLDKWDPLGVGENPNLRNEYDEVIERFEMEAQRGRLGLQDVARILREEGDKYGGGPAPQTIENCAAEVFALMGQVQTAVRFNGAPEPDGTP